MIPLQSNNGIYNDLMDSLAAAGVTADEIASGAVTLPYPAKNGWSWVVVDSIEVKDHTLTIGVSSDSLVTKAEKNFSGTWFSCDKFQLTYFKAGDNSDFNYDTPVSSIVADERLRINVRDGRITVLGGGRFNVYTLSGQAVPDNAALAKGVYIVRAHGVATKVLVP